MTYCVGMRLNQGLVFMSDTRTNAGIDNIFTFRKMFTWEVPGERVITLMTAGNLATTQAVVSHLDDRTRTQDQREPEILKAPTMFQVAQMVGEQLRYTVKSQAPDGPASESTFSATIIIGGQIAGSQPRLFLIYPEGNFIEASEENPFFQIGEAKYGRPVLLHGYDPEMRFEDAVKLLLLSFDSTMKANLSVGMPLDLVTVEKDALAISHQRRFEADDPYFRALSERWGDVINNAIGQLDPFVFSVG